MLFDVLAGIFWSITYALIVLFAITDKNKTRFYIPIIAIEFNFAWEIAAWHQSGGAWIHILWSVLDAFIFVTHAYIIYKNLFSKQKKLSRKTKKRRQKKYQTEKQKKQNRFTFLKYLAIPTYIILLIVLTISFHFIFRYVTGMLLSSFIIDVIMQISFLLSFLHLSQRGQIPIAATKLIGDLFAWIFCRNSMIEVNIMGIMLLILNTCYLIIVIVRRIHPFSCRQIKNERPQKDAK